MSVNDKTSGLDSSSKRRARWLKMIGVIVLLLGISSAGLVYWMGTRSPDVSDDLSMLGYNRAQTRQMGMLYGKMGLLIEDWSNDLKQPGTQAILIASASILITLGCFYFARLLENGDETH
jgi:peptidoglycan/LPS O-acetylase OafA/YrhL